MRLDELDNEEGPGFPYKDLSVATSTDPPEYAAKDDFAEEDYAIETKKELPGSAEKTTGKKTIRKPSSLVTVVCTILGTVCTIAALSAIYAAIVSYCIAHDWELMYKYLNEYYAIDLTLGLSSLVGLKIYYSLCRYTEAARSIGKIFGAVFILLNAIMIFSNPIYAFVSTILVVVYFSSKNEWLKQDSAKLAKRKSSPDWLFIEMIAALMASYFLLRTTSEENLLKATPSLVLGFLGLVTISAGVDGVKERAGRRGSIAAIIIGIVAILFCIFFYVLLFWLLR